MYEEITKMDPYFQTSQKRFCIFKFHYTFPPTFVFKAFFKFNIDETANPKHRRNDPLEKGYDSNMFLTSLGFNPQFKNPQQTCTNFDSQMLKR